MEPEKPVNSKFEAESMDCEALLAMPSARLDLLQLFGPGHSCRACRDLFYSHQARESLCGSCRLIVEDRVKALEAIVTGSSDVAQAFARVKAELKCSDCQQRWPGRKRPPKTIEQLRAALPAWALADHCHFMRHVFFNRFPYSKRFFPPLPPKQAREIYQYTFSRKWQQKWERFFKTLMSPPSDALDQTAPHDSAPGPGS